MTRDHGFKRLVRARMLRAGESYSTARAHLLDHRSRDPRTWAERAEAQPNATSSLALLSQRELVEFLDADLIERCVAPVSTGMRRTGSADAQRLYLRQLTPAQAALLVFWMLYAFAKDGLTSFCRAYSHRLGDEDFWTFLQFGLRHFGDDNMLALMKRLRSEVDLLVGPLVTSSPDDQNAFDPARVLRVSTQLEQFDVGTVRDLDDEFRQLMPSSLQRVGRMIRDNPAEYAVIEAKHA